MMKELRSIYCTIALFNHLDVQYFLKDYLLFTISSLRIYKCAFNIQYFN